ncbi:hypothetical protein HY768_02240 [candidate division TA06 bacterium]|uniref:Uncharacterized protein n=1 Tax=candidate division TA06 bacterium TaxID=2250710 RepID=A0A933IB36_UNCT6|nr:hypothetical protein [candidate division TA06 bacterium]
MAVIQESEGNLNYPMVVFGVRSGHINKKDSTLNIEWGGLLEFFPGKGPFYLNLDEGGNSDEEQKGTQFQFNLDVKHQWLINTALDGSLRLRCCFPLFTYPDLSLVLGKNIKGHDIYLEAGQNIRDFNSLYNQGLNGLTLVKTGARLPLTEKTAFVVEAGRSWGYIYAGLGIEF